jgi:hypothetical protein
MAEGGVDFERSEEKAMDEYVLWVVHLRFGFEFDTFDAPVGDSSCLCFATLFWVD